MLFSAKTNQGPFEEENVMVYNAATLHWFHPAELVVTETVFSLSPLKGK